MFLIIKKVFGFCSFSIQTPDTNFLISRAFGPTICRQDNKYRT